MSKLHDVVITGIKRTPVGSFQGSLATVPATELGSIAIKAVVEDAKLTPDLIDEVIMGNVLPAGTGQAPARQAALGAGLPDSVECLTINKVCGSGLKAVMLATQTLQTGDAQVIIAGGMENMSRVPYLLPKARTGYRLGHGKIIDGMVNDGLWDVYNDIHMGNCAEICATERNYTREKQDKYARTSYERAHKAQAAGWFNAEITPVEIPQRKGEPVIIIKDEEPTRANFEKMLKLRPAFDREGTITAANASKINDGAGAALLMSEEKALELGLSPMVRIVSQASAAQAPEWFTTAPVKAIKKALDKAGMTADQIDLWEINEAFAAVAMAAIDDYKLPIDKVNIQGGAIAIGHPIGASGIRILATLVHAMKRIGARTGLATLCIGGGEAAAVIVEVI
ncbi:MAG: thiolase family protein [Candidatus Marinimicrobia bacterium]|nr:thiolase family protein [Candidatus Neomarinimicrobiota bacterium]